MIGITSFGAYVPQHRLTPETKGCGFPFEKAVGYYDEDSLTMAVAAALDCGKYLRAWEDRFVIDEGYFKVLPGTVTSFIKKQSLPAKEISKVVLYAPDRRRHGDMA
jgi:3-hydroxy-3-methylglutaryl CoA synthase